MADQPQPANNNKSIEEVRANIEAKAWENRGKTRQALFRFLLTGELPEWYDEREAYRLVADELRGSPYAVREKSWHGGPIGYDPAPLIAATKQQQAKPVPPSAASRPEAYRYAVSQRGTPGTPPPTAGQYATGLVAQATGDRRPTAADVGIDAPQSVQVPPSPRQSVPGLPALAGGSGDKARQPQPQAIPGLPATGSGTGLLPAQAGVLATPGGEYEDEVALAALIREMGLDPTRLSPVGQYAARQLSAIVPTLRELMPFMNGGDGMQADPMSIAPQLQQLAQQFSQRGANPYATVRGIGNQAAGSAGFQSLLAGLSDPVEAYKMLSSTLNARTFGNSGLVRQSLADQAQRTLQGYGLADYDSGGVGTGTFYDWLGAQPQATRSLFGLA